jgi:hypothetical protein
VYAPSHEDISGWVAEVVWGLNGKQLMRNAWRKTGYDWFFDEGVGDVGVNVGDNGNGDDVIDDDSDGSDEECDIADMLDDVLLFDEEDSDIESDDDEMLWGEM